jgi:hypothetical protein
MFDFGQFQTIEIFFIFLKPYGFFSVTSPITIKFNIMKKVFLAFVFFFGMVAIVNAMPPITKQMKVTKEQVPVSILTVFENEYGDVTSSGHWVANVEMVSSGSRTVVTPIWYSYVYKENKSRKEIRFSPAGEIIAKKG